MTISRHVDRIAESYFGRESLVLKLHLQHIDLLIVRLLILGDIGEIEISELHHGLQILGYTGATERSVGTSEAGAYSYILTSQCLAHFIVGETAQTAGFHHTCEYLQIAEIGFAVKVRTTIRKCIHDHLILLEIGLLQNDTHTIGERQFLIAKGLILGLLLDGTGLRELGLIHDGLVLHIVHISLHLGGACISHGRLQQFGREIDLAFLLLF